ncbi:MAG: hypothetical protein U0Q16_10630 [Bryobacteraceae bacterium]
MPKKKAIALALSSALTAQAAELPVRHVVLYKHGVGYFERAGDLAPGEGARLDFKATEMNDVLKSLTVDVKGGKGVAGLRYDSSEPVAKKLGQFPFKMTDQQPVSALLDQLKGAQLELKMGGQTVTGLIVSARIIAGARDQAEREQVTLLLDSGEMRAFEIGTGIQFRFPDPKLQLQLKDYLNTLLQSRSTDKRTVYIDSVDSGRRQVAASYMVPVPVWKSSYRLIFPDTGEPTLEGWAIVDNTTGEDWANVNLSVVSGRPISFISRLYEPRYVDRPFADLADQGATGPVLHGAVVADEMAPVAGLAGAAMGKVQRLRSPAPAMAAMAPPPPAPKAEMSTFAATAQGREAGDLFEYRFDKPVTVRKSESAMLPFLQQKLPARKLLIYSDPGSPHPTNAAELTNGSGKTLDGGPVTVYDAGVYAGEALFETIKTGDKRLISYGTDIGTRITTAFDSSEQLVRELHLRNGVLTAKSTMQETRTFTIKNVDSKAKTLIVEHPVRYGYKIVSPKPIESTATAYRFEVKLAPSAETKFVVQDERTLDEQYSISNVDTDLLLSWVQNKALSAQGRKSLEQILEKKRQISAVDVEVSQAQTQIQELTQDQQRIRQNLESLNKVSGQQEQVQRYARQLADQESQLASLRDRMAASRKRRTALESELNTLINSMTF